MSRYATVETYVEVEVDISEFDTEDLIDELESRGEMVVGETCEGYSSAILTDIWMKRRMGQDYQRELDELIYTVLGKVI